MWIVNALDGTKCDNDAMIAAAAGNETPAAAERWWWRHVSNVYLVLKVSCPKPEENQIK